MTAGPARRAARAARRGGSSGRIEAVGSARQRHPAAQPSGQARERPLPWQALAATETAVALRRRRLAPRGFAALKGVLGSPCGSNLNEAGTPQGSRSRNSAPSSMPRSGVVLSFWRGPTRPTTRFVRQMLMSLPVRRLGTPWARNARRYGRR